MRISLFNQILFSFDHRLPDSSPIAWILAFPISNVRQAAVVESGQVNSMRCADSGALLSNVSFSTLSEPKALVYILTVLLLGMF